MNNPPTPVRKTVQQLREERGLTREELAAAVKASFYAIWRLENRPSMPRADLVERLYIFFDIPVGSIEWLTKPSKSVA